MSGPGDRGTTRGVLANLAWRFGEQSGAALLTLAVSIVLARLLAPAEFGLIALVLVVTNILAVVVDGGFGAALIQRQDVEERDFDTIFWVNLGVCAGLYGLLWAASPLIAAFYRQPELTGLTRELGLVLFCYALKAVQQAYVSRQLRFRRFFFATLGGTLAGGGLGIGLALAGWGVQALVAQQLVTQAVGCAVLWFTTGWRPHLRFAAARVGPLFAFGWKILASTLIDAVYNNLRQLVIGRLYTPGDLAFFNRGRSFPYGVVANVNRSIDSVLFPVLSRRQDDRAEVRAVTRRAIRVSSYAMWPLMAGLAVVAEPLVRLLLTDKWAPAVPILQWCCLVFGFYPVHTANLNAIKAIGRSDIYLRLELVKKAVGVVLLLAAMRFGVMAIVYALVAGTLLSTAINAWPNRRLLDYPYGRQLADLLPSLGLAAAVAAAVWPLRWTGLGDLALVCCQLAAGTTAYVGLSALLKFDAWVFAKATLLGLWRGRQAGPAG